MKYQSGWAEKEAQMNLKSRLTISSRKHKIKPKIESWQLSTYVSKS